VSAHVREQTGARRGTFLRVASAQHAMRALKSAGALGCLASFFAPLTSVLDQAVVPFELLEVRSGTDAFFALLIALAFLGPSLGAAHAWLARRPESLVSGALELAGSLYSAWFMFGFTQLGTPTPFAIPAVLCAALYGAGVVVHLVRAWRARRATVVRDRAE
jgi:hypothetical protein